MPPGVGTVRGAAGGGAQEGGAAGRLARRRAYLKLCSGLPVPRDIAPPRRLVPVRVNRSPLRFLRLGLATPRRLGGTRYSGTLRR